jgi:hypothetical protein
MGRKVWNLTEKDRKDLMLIINEATSIKTKERLEFESYLKPFIPGQKRNDTCFLPQIGIFGIET